MPLISETDKAYIAGIVDGEGSIYLVKHSKYKTRLGYNYAIVRIANNNIELLKYINSFYDSKIVYKKKRNNNNSAQYDLYFTGKQIEPFLSDIEPYLRVKKDQANILLAVLEENKHCNVRKDNGEYLFEFRELCYWVLREKNLTGDIAKREEFVKNILYYLYNKDAIKEVKV